MSGGRQAARRGHGGIWKTLRITFSLRNTYRVNSILHALKQSWGDRVTTVFPRQGHYAFDPDELRKYPKADYSLDSIAELTTLTRENLAG